MSNRKLADLGGVLATPEMMLCAAGISLWPEKAVKEYKRKQLIRERIRFSLKCLLLVSGLSTAIVWGCPPNLMTGLLFITALCFAVWFWWHMDNVVWHSNQVEHLYGWRYYRDGKMYTLPEPIKGIAQTLLEMFPRGKVKVAFIGTDPILECHVDGQCLVPVIWDELRCGKILIIKKPVE